MMSNGIDGSVVSQQGGSGGGQYSAQEELRTNLIVNYLPQTMTEEELCSLFSSIGEVKSCRVIRNRITGQSMGYGFVKYLRPEDAKMGILKLNQLRVENKTLQISYARPSSEAIQGANLFVSGLPKNMTQQELKDLFSPYGHIITSRVIYDNIAVRQYVPEAGDNVPGISKGIGFIRFDQRMEAERSVRELNGAILEGSTEPISVQFAIPRDNTRAIQPLVPYLAPQARSRFAGPINYRTGRFRYSPVAGDLLANSMLPGNAMNGSGWCIFVYNLSPTAKENLLWQLFGPFGTIQSVKVMRHLQTNKCKGFGFVTMANYDEAVVAIQSLDGYTLGSHVLQVSFKTNKRNNCICHY